MTEQPTLQLPLLNKGWEWSISNGYLFIKYNRKTVHLKVITLKHNGRWSSRKPDNPITEAAILNTAQLVLQELPKVQAEQAHKDYYHGTYRPGYETKPLTSRGQRDLNTLLPQLNEGWSWYLDLHYSTAKLELKHGSQTKMKEDVHTLSSRLSGFGVMSSDITPEQVSNTAHKMFAHYPAYEKAQEATKVDTSWDGSY